MHLLQNIHCEFYGDGISSIDTIGGILLGRPYIGVAVLWRKSLDTFVKVIKLEDETKLMDFDIDFGIILYHILNVYMPFDCNDNMNDFMYYLYKIDTVFKNNHTVYNMVILDFISDLLRLSMFGRELCKFCDEKCYTIGDQKHLLENTFTFQSDAHDTVSWLDRAICSTAIFNKITSMNVLYSYLTSDYFVLSDKLDNVINEIPPDLCNDSYDTFNKRVHWDRLTCDTLSTYTDLTDLYCMILILCGMLYVAGSMCTMNEHIHRRGVIDLFGHTKSPEKQNTIINITVISQKQLQYHNYNTIHNTIYTVDIKYPSFIHHAYILNTFLTIPNPSITHP